MLILLRWSISYTLGTKWGLFIWFWLNRRNFIPPIFQFLVGFSFKTIFAPLTSTTTFISKDTEFSCASFGTCEEFAASWRENTLSYCWYIELFKLGLFYLLNSYFKVIYVYIEHAHGSHMFVTSLWRHIEQDFLIREVVIQLINQIGQKLRTSSKSNAPQGHVCLLYTSDAADE